MHVRAGEVLSEIQSVEGRKHNLAYGRSARDIRDVHETGTTVSCPDITSGSIMVNALAVMFASRAFTLYLGGFHLIRSYNQILELRVDRLECGLVSFRG